MSRRAAWTAALAALACIVPLAGALLILALRFDGLYGQDPFAYYDYALGPLRERLLAGRAPPPFFWPPGYPLLVAAASFVVGESPRSGQVVSLLAGGAVPVFTALLARELIAPEFTARTATDLTAPTSSPTPRTTRSGMFVPLTAGLLAAFTGQLWQSSVVVMADVAGLAAAVAGMWALARWGGHRPVGWLLLAAFLIAAATLCRWVYGLLAIPCTLYAVHALWRQPDRARAVARGAAAAAVAFIVLLPVLGGAVSELTGGAASGSVTPPGSAESVGAFAGNFRVYDWHPLRAFGTEFLTMDGRLRHDVPNIIYYGLAPARWSYFTPVLAVLLLPGVWLAARRGSTALRLLVLGWLVMVLGFHLGAPYQNFRFTLAFLPPLAILAALGAAGLRSYLAGRFMPPATAHRLVLLQLAAGLTIMAAAGVHTTRVLAARKDASIATVRWVETQIAADASLLTFGLTLTFRHYSTLSVHDLYELDPARLARLTAAPGPLYVLIEQAAIAGQWEELAPGRNVRWLENGPGLVEVARREAYTLYLVGPNSSDLFLSFSFGHSSYDISTFFGAGSGITRRLRSRHSRSVAEGRTGRTGPGA